jgi:hypothetical protein
MHIIERVNLRTKLEQARRTFDAKLAEVLTSRPDLSHAKIRHRFGISDKVIRRVIREFNIGNRNRGPKPRKRFPSAAGAAHGRVPATEKKPRRS